MERVLKRQLKKLGLDATTLPNADSWCKLLETVSTSYVNADKERRLLEHSIQVNSDEMFSLHRQLKKQVLQRSEQLDISELKQNRVFEVIADGIVIFSEDGLITGFNNAAESIFCYSKDETLGENISILVPEKYSNNNLYFFGGKENFNQTREIIGINSQGNPFSMELNVAPLGSKIGGYVGVFRDISERKLKEMELVKAKEAAESSDRAKSTFLASMSHELRTPLNAILGFAELFEYAPNLNDKLKANATEIYSAGSHLLELINEVLNMSKIELATIELSIEKIELNELINECFLLSENLAHEKMITLIWEGNEPYTFMSDYTRTKQIIVNLLSNAIKYNKPNGSVICNYYINSQGNFNLTVKDSGIGIDESLLPSLFEPFNRLGAENSIVEGTGLGLTITKKLVEAMGGSISVISSRGVGSQFTVHFTHPQNQKTKMVAI